MNISKALINVHEISVLKITIPGIEITDRLWMMMSVPSRTFW
jgi:hypothetical protein